MFVPAFLALFVTGTVAVQADHGGHGHGPSFLNSLAASPSLTASVVPANGDGNPYGVAVVPSRFPFGGTIHSHDILVSNFNNGAKQGTGTTIVAVTPSGATSTFFTAPSSLAPVGLTTALVALRSGIVVVGNTPTTDGTSSTVSKGSLIFIDRSGNVLLNLKDATLLQGPWDMTADDSNFRAPVLFVSNVLSGTITRISLRIHWVSGNPMPVVTRMVQIASGFTHRTDPNALLVGPTGLLLRGENRGHRSAGHRGRKDGGRRDDNGGGALYVADTGNDSIQLLKHVFARNVHDGTGKRVVSGGPLEGPLGLAWSPKGTIVASNGDAAGPKHDSGNINRVVEINPNGGKFVATRRLDTSKTAGAIFGIAIARVNGKSSLIYVNDNTNALNVLPQK
jgi:hypothetical protein